MSLNFISSLFLFKCLLFDKKFFNSFLHSNNWSKSLENIFNYEISHDFLSFPMLFMNILCNESNLLIKYLFMFYTLEYSVSNLAKLEFSLILWFCLIKYCPKNKHGLNLCLTYSSIWSVLFINSYSYLDKAIIPYVRVGSNFYTKYKSL